MLMLLLKVQKPKWLARQTCNRWMSVRRSM